MKRTSNNSSLTFRCSHRAFCPRLARVLTAAFGLTAVAILFAQSQRRTPASDAEVQRAFSDLAILDPVSANAFLDSIRTPEDEADAARARLAINNPAAYNALFVPRDATQEAAHEKAVFEFTHPFDPSPELEERRKDAAYRQAEAEALHAIRHPVRQSAP